VRSRVITLIGLVVVALGVAQFALGIALETEFGQALAAEFGWLSGHNFSHNPYPIGYAFPTLVLACVVGGIIAGVGIAKSRSKFSRWV
jgi:hypothetical protein